MSESCPGVRHDGPWLALDVGGANVKSAGPGGVVLSTPFELWREPAGLGREVARAVGAHGPFSAVGLTMTAELCDCYPSKRAGVRAVLDAVGAAVGGRPVAVWGTDGRFRTASEARLDPLPAAAANWLALATVAAGMTGGRDGLLIDVGSTTTDLIPLRAGAVAAVGRTDTARLATGELVYAGARRTPVFALADRLPFAGRSTGLAAELFATTLDVRLVLGEAADDPADLATADGRPATAEYARDRLARVVGADRETCTAGDAVGLAGAALEALLARLATAAGSACAPLGGRPEFVLAAGSGESLALRVGARAVAHGGRVVALSDLWGPAGSGAGCARAVLELVSRPASAGV